jgi:hypothetical protein
MKKLLLCLAIGSIAASAAVAQAFFFRPLRIECDYCPTGVGPELEYAIPAGDMNIAFLVAMDISLSMPDYGGIGFGSRIYPFGVDGDGFYISPMGNLLLDGFLTNYSLSLDGGYRLILFDFLTGFAEAGGVMYYNNYTYASTFGFNFSLGLGVAL